MNRTEIRRLFANNSIFRVKGADIDKWIEENNINCRNLVEPPFNTRSNNLSRVIIMLRIFGPFGQCSVGWSADFAKHMVDSLNDKWYPENQIVNVKYSERGSWSAMIQISTETMKTLSYDDTNGCYFKESNGIVVDGRTLSPIGAKNNVFVCDSCNERHLLTLANKYTSNGVTRTVCQNCRESVRCATCENCGEVTLMSDMKLMESKLICKKCFDEIYVKDEISNQYIRRTNAVRLHDANWYGRGKMVSRKWMEETYPNAARCEYSGEYYTDPDQVIDLGDRKVSKYFAENAIRSYHSFSRANYSYKLFNPYEPKPMRFFGTEIECQGDEDNAIYIKQNFGDIFHCERDSSITGGGIEFISNPMTMRFVKSNYSRISEMFKWLEEHGMKSQNTDCCGFHVHIAREAFRDERAVDFFSAMVTCFKKNIEIIARRRDGYYYSYGQIDGPVTQRKIRMKPNRGHGVCVNLSNTNTVEIRVFRGTLSPETYMATLEFVNNLVDASNNDEQVIRFGDLLDGEYLPAYVETREALTGERIDREAIIDFTHYDEEVC